MIFYWNNSLFAFSIDFNLEDFYCRLKIGSSVFYCNHSGTETIDGVTVEIKNSGNASDIGDRSNIWGN